LNVKKLFKKLAIPVMATALIIPMLPNKVFASDYTNGLLDGADISSNNYPIETYDNDLSTGYTSSGSSTGASLIFDISKSINEIYVNVDGSVSLTFKDSVGNTIGTEEVSTTGYLTVNYEDVTQVNYSQLNDGSTVYEVDLFGSNYSSDTTAPGEVTNVTTISGNQQVTLDFTLPSDSDFSNTNVYYSSDGGSTFTQFTETNNTDSTATVTGLTNDTSYTFKVTTVDTSGNESTGTTTTATPTATTDTTAPGEVTSITSTIGTTTVDLSWVNPSDSDFSHVNIERNGTTIATSVTGDVYSDSGLSEGTDYTYTIYTVDTSGNVSTGTSTTVTTDTTTDTVAPEAPLNVTGKALNKGAYIDWDSNTETDLNGYNIYKDGVKVNTSLVYSSHFSVGDLTNGTAYDFTVTAVDTSGNESLHSLSATVTPDANAMPPIETNYELQDVSDGVSNWFTELWMILAFAVGIPLAFLISNRIKGLFVG